ncbi:MAG: hypothetical protein PHS56_01600 [Eubacteriales bacterium]|nr:hypothetical protein [Eubacteriales bacterium]MDD4078281.1 hypothetical protein [Eubacteriales bacterium]
MHPLLDKIETLLIKVFLILFGFLILFQLMANNPGWSDILVLLNRLEGAVYKYSGLQ